jgi:hypothetical protein
MFTHRHDRHQAAVSKAVAMAVEVRWLMKKSTGNIIYNYLASLTADTGAWRWLGAGLALARMSAGAAAGLSLSALPRAPSPLLPAAPSLSPLPPAPMSRSAESSSLGCQP